MSKYHSKKTVVDGHKFDSKKEAERYKELKALEELGVIEDLKLQPRFVLQESFKDSKWGAQRAITYVADFLYKEDRKTVVEDVKGMKTDVYRIKKKLFLKLYPGIDFREV